MKDYTSPIFSDYRKRIKKFRDKGMLWENIMLAGKDNEKELDDFLDLLSEAFGIDKIDVSDWKELVKRAEQAEIESMNASLVENAAMIKDEGQDSAVFVPTDDDSSWQRYRNRLLKQGFKEKVVDEMERSTLRTLKRLNSDTRGKEPVKGLIIGNVQSGKTANMEALMCMAADWGWNMFIILSGTIENLRKQTQSRMLNDLTQAGGSLSWRGLEKLSKHCKKVDKAQYLNFSQESHDRFFTVTLKNSTRLFNLIEWLQDDTNKQRQMRILLIDDEADQASINTRKILSNVEEQERNRINSLIINLVSGLGPKGEKKDAQYLAMNYIGYTATPYASILNESSLESLYPRNFVSTLSVSKEYFGPQQIFGVDGEDYDGMNIIRTIQSDDLKIYEQMHGGKVSTIPPSMIDAICWFLCGASAMRLWNYKKPVSMLIHTSQKQEHHQYVYEAVRKWLIKERKNILNRCREVWAKETEEFTFENFRAQYFDYDSPDENIHQYPSFSELEDGIRQLCAKITNIPLGEEGELSYHSGIHICVDNCRNNGINEDGMYMRLAYPEAGHMPCSAPAFIVIGGATLSRGLTIEGVISTVFLRAARQSDTLMQMGRWFGYRKGYELLPRIWLTEKTRKQFLFLSSLDQELREEIYYMDKAGISPSEYGPRVKNTPSYQFIRITAANRMQGAQPADVDYSGSRNQTIIFDNNKEILAHNITVCDSFIESLGKPVQNTSNIHAKNALIWRNVELSKVVELLKNMKFSARMRVFNDITSIEEWLTGMTEKGEIGRWSIVASGNAAGEIWHTPAGDLHKVTRTRRINGAQDSEIIDIGVLRNPTDLIADVDVSKFSEEDMKMVNNYKTPNAALIREKGGCARTPQIILYRIDKNSKYVGEGQRGDLEAPEDIIGVCMNIPGVQKGKNFAATVQIRLEDVMDDDHGDVQGNEA